MLVAVWAVLPDPGADELRLNMFHLLFLVNGLRMLVLSFCVAWYFFNVHVFQGFSVKMFTCFFAYLEMCDRILVTPLSHGSDCGDVAAKLNNVAIFSVL